MKDIYQKYSAIFEGRVLRERIIILCVTLATVYFAFDFFVYQPIDAKRGKLEGRFNSVNEELTVLETEKTVFLGALTNNPNVAKEREISKLEARVDELNEEIDRLSSGLVAAERLPEVIREVFVHSKGLSLLGLIAEKPESLNFARSGEEKSDVSAGVFKHSVTFKMKGKYFDLMNHIERLEDSQWHFYWQALDYQVDKYPNAIVQVEVYTLSTERGFIGE